MSPCHIVIIMAGKYASYSKWIEREIRIAKAEFADAKPILGVKPWAATQVSSVVSENADNLVGWNTNSIVGDDFTKQVPNRVVVVFDEAYCEYVEDEEYADLRKYVKEGRNVLIVRTFSKLYGLGGLRVGYGVGKKELVEYLRRALSAFHVGALNLIGAAASLDDDEHILRSREHNSKEKQFLYEQFDRLGLQYLPSQCNFVLLVELGRDVQALWEGLVRHGLVVTPARAFGVPDAIRISLGTREENERLVEALQQVLAEVPAV